MIVLLFCKANSLLLLLVNGGTAYLRGRPTCTLSRFSISGAHAHWVGSTNTPELCH